jgi:hypothetical protein
MSVPRPMYRWGSRRILVQNLLSEGQNTQTAQRYHNRAN